MVNNKKWKKDSEEKKPKYNPNSHVNYVPKSTVHQLH